jgi:hypothetical protein
MQTFQRQDERNERPYNLFSMSMLCLWWLERSPVLILETAPEPFSGRTTSHNRNPYLSDSVLSVSLW